MQTFDVAILGSGMAGTILATLLAKQNVSVILIDASSHPRFAVGESTIPHTSLLLSLLAQQYGVPEIDNLAYPDRIAQHVCTTCGIKRSFGFAYHRPGQPHQHPYAHHFGTSSKDENHLFRQDTDVYLLHTAVQYGATLALNTRVTNIDFRPGGVHLTTHNDNPIHARFVIDGTGHTGVLANQLGLRETPTRLQHHSRTLFTHMIDVQPFAADSPFLLPWEKSTLHHVFEGGWFWVIPFNNRTSSTNRLVSVGLTVDPRKYPRPEQPPATEFQQFLNQFPSIAQQFQHAKAIRPWVSTGRVQYSSHQIVGQRYCLMAHSAGFVDPLYSRGLINTLEIIQALIPPLLNALQHNDFDPAPFQIVEQLHRRVLAYNDQLVRGAYTAWADFDLWDAWLRVWALGTILAEYRLMNALTDYTNGDCQALGDRQVLQGSASNPIFTPFEDPDYANFFPRALHTLDQFTAQATTATEAAQAIYQLADSYPFTVPLRRDAMRRAGWLGQDEHISDRNINIARQGYRWAITNPTSRDLFGNAETFLRWRAKQSDPHLK